MLKSKIYVVFYTRGTHIDAVFAHGGRDGTEYIELWREDIKTIFFAKCVYILSKGFFEFVPYY